MAIAAKISSAELTAQVTDRFVDQYFEARLINAPGITYEPGITNDNTFLGFEVAEGTGGYGRQVLKYRSGDVSAYSDDGVALATKATVFAQDGGTTAIPFTHVALVWSQGNVATLGTPTSEPATGNNGTYSNVPQDSTSGVGKGFTVNIGVSGGSVFSYVINSAGYDYTDTDTITISSATLQGLGITTESTDLIIPVATVSSGSIAGQVLAVAQTSSAVSLTGGNEAAFYWNLKQFGYYSV